MGKVFVALLLVVLGGYVVYNRYAAPPLDARAAIEAGVEQVKATTKISDEQEQLLRVQLAIADYTASNNGEPPEVLEALVPKYFDIVPDDPATGEPYKYAKNGNTYQLGAEISSETMVVARAGTSSKGAAAKGGKGKSDAEENFVNPNTMELESFTYDPTGKRDPFEPFDFAPSAYEDLSVPPLERYSLHQLRVTAILTDSKNGEFYAIVEDVKGRGYTVRRGTRIGNQNGVVVSIDNEQINVVETTVDFTGKETKIPQTLKRPARGEDDTYSTYSQKRSDRGL